MPLTIQNLRLNHANNSSSSHSVLLLPEDGAGVPRGRAPEYGDQHFGWDHFRLTTLESKAVYLAVVLRQALHRQLGPTHTATLIRELLGVTLQEDASIDHQSLFGLPYHGEQLDEQFFAELWQWWQQDRVVVLGGNDNTDYDLPAWAEGATKLNLPDSAGRALQSRKNTDGSWTLYNQHTGAKLRLTFVEPTRGVRNAPELVDVKLTDACPFQCAFCYQGSTPRGATASSGAWEELVSVLGAHRVFEVALGGGEPTFDPRFAYVLASARRHHIVPNFTTRSLHWLRDPALLRAVADHAGSFAYSVHEANDIVAFEAAWLSAKALLPADMRPTLQLVVGVASPYVLEQALTFGGRHAVHVTLLGFKETGLGAAWACTTRQGATLPDWLTQVRTLRTRAHHPLYTRVNIDTALARQYEAALRTMDLPPYTYHIEEGVHSYYVDLVTREVAPSSYAPAEQRHALARFADLPLYWGRGEVV